MRTFNQKGITILALVIWVLIVGAAIIYAPKAYQYVLDRNVQRLVTSNVEKVESEIRSELLTKHPIQIWHDMDGLINGLNFQNPVAFSRQTKNGWSRPGDVVVTFDGIDTFRLDGIGTDGSSLRLNIVIQKSN
jgi:hypothetical protein